MRKNLNLDSYSICGAGLCAIHCLFSGIIVAMIPSLNLIFHNEVFHLVLLIFTVIFATSAIFNGFKVHKRAFIIPLFISSLGLLVLAYLTEEGLLSISNMVSPQTMTLMGSLTLILTHLCNLVLLRKLRVKRPPTFATKNEGHDS